MLICICGVGMIWLTRRRLWISGHLLLDLGENREELRGNSFERKYGCKTVAILLSSTSFTHTKLWLHDIDEKSGCLSLSSTA
jgi:hypothetical protein